MAIAVVYLCCNRFEFYGWPDECRLPNGNGRAIDWIRNLHNRDESVKSDEDELLKKKIHQTADNARRNWNWLNYLNVNSIQPRMLLRFVGNGRHNSPIWNKNFVEKTMGYILTCYLTRLSCFFKPITSITIGVFSVLMTSPWQMIDAACMITHSFMVGVC